MHGDDFSRGPVGTEVLRPWWYLLIIEMGVMISIPIFVFGGQLGLGMTPLNLIGAVFAGAAVLGVIGGLTARLGAVTRCSTALLARYTFGKKGCAIIVVTLALALAGWWGVQTEMFASAVVHLAASLFGVALPQGIVVVIAGCAMITTAALGIRAIGKLSYIAVPLLLAGLAYALSALRDPTQLSLLMDYGPGAGAIAFGTAAATVTGGFIVGACANPDYSRFARNTRHAVGYAVGDYALAYPLVLIACGMIAVIFGTHEILPHLVPRGCEAFVFVLMMLATWAANDCNLYSTSLNLTVLISRGARPLWAVAAGVVGIGLALFHVAEHMISFLVLIGILIAPVGGIFIVENLDRKTVISEEELANVPAWRRGPLLAWCGGVVIGYLATDRDALGLGLIHLTGVPTLDSLLAATAIMALVRLRRKF